MARCQAFSARTVLLKGQSQTVVATKCCGWLVVETDLSMRSAAHVEGQLWGVVRRGEVPLNLQEIVVQPVRSCEESRYQELLRQHHYLGALPKISETLWYVASWREQWVALLSFSASALKCGARDRWIGWHVRHRYSRLKLIINNSRFLILPDWHCANLGSRVLSLCEQRLPRDWEAFFGHRVLLMETFVDPQRFHPFSWDY